MNIGETIKELRVKKGLSASELARRSGVSQPYLSQLETGKNNNPTSEMISKIASGLGVEYRELMAEAGYWKELARIASSINSKNSKNEQDVLINPENFPDPFVITKNIKVPSHYKVDGESRDFMNSDILDLFYLIEMSKGRNELLNLKYKGKSLSGEDKEKILSMLELLLK